MRIIICSFRSDLIKSVHKYLNVRVLLFFRLDLVMFYSQLNSVTLITTTKKLRRPSCVFWKLNWNDIESVPFSLHLLYINCFISIKLPALIWYISLIFLNNYLCLLFCVHMLSNFISYNWILVNIYQNKLNIFKLIK